MSRMYRMYRSVPVTYPAVAGVRVNRYVSGAVEQTSLGQKVLNYANGVLNSQVGDGECWALANAALAGAGARTPGTGGLGTYEFGQLVFTGPGGSPSSYVLPGDIIQFDNVELAYADGAHYSFPKHTAIVSRINGLVFTVIEQNSNGKRYVTEGTYDLGRATKGKYYVYRPIPR
jgi:hypothetical protein